MSIEAEQPDKTDCTHEVTEWGRCVGCGDPIERDAVDYDDRASDKFHVPRPIGCMNRGWYHDGSEEHEAFVQKRSVRPCPHHGIGASV